MVKFTFECSRVIKMSKIKKKVYPMYTWKERERDSFQSPSSFQIVLSRDVSIVQCLQSSSSLLHRAQHDPLVVVVGRHPGLLLPPGSAMVVPSHRSWYRSGPFFSSFSCTFLLVSHPYACVQVLPLEHLPVCWQGSVQGWDSTPSFTF